MPTDPLSALSDASTQAMSYAHDEAAALRHNHIGPEPVLVGILRLEHESFVERLRERGIDLARVRSGLESTFGKSGAPPEHIFLTPRGRLVVEFAVDESRKRGGHGRVEPVHLLLGILRDDGSVAGRILHSLGVAPEWLREEIASELPGG